MSVISMPVARRNGKAAHDRWVVEASSALGLHTHALTKDGLWCVTRQPIGYLWAHVRWPAAPSRV